MRRQVSLTRAQFVGRGHEALHDCLLILGAVCAVAVGIPIRLKSAAASIALLAGVLLVAAVVIVSVLLLGAVADGSENRPLPPRLANETSPCENDESASVGGSSGQWPLQLSQSHIMSRLGSVQYQRGNHDHVQTLPEPEFCVTPRARFHKDSSLFW